MTTTSNRDSHFFVAGFNCHMHRKDANAVFKETAATAPAAVGGPTPAGWRLVPAVPTCEWIGAVADDGYEDCNCSHLIANILSHAPAAPALEAPAAPAIDVSELAISVCQRVAELPDRNSPEDWPDAMLVTTDELGGIVRDEIMQALNGSLAAAPQAPAAPLIPQWIDDPHDIEQGQILNPAWVHAQAAPAVGAPAAPEWQVMENTGTHGHAAAGFYVFRDGRCGKEWMRNKKRRIACFANRAQALAAIAAAAPQAPAAHVDDLAQLVKQLVRTLRKAAPGNDLAEKAMDYLKRQGLQGSPLRAAPEAPLAHAGVLAAAAHIQAKAQAHAEEHGHYDPDTGAFEMSEAAQDYYNTLTELADEIRMMAAPAAPDYAKWCNYIAGVICTYLGKPDEGEKATAIAGIIERRLWTIPAAPAAPAVDAQGARDAAFEAVRNRLCGLQRYSFVLDDDGVVRQVQDRTGNWIEFDDAHELFDPVAVEAAIAAQAAAANQPAK